MRDTVGELLVRFRDWVEGNEPHPEDDVSHDETPPELPFSWTPPRRSRFRELTLRERAGIWLDAHALRLLSGLYNIVSILICLMLVVLLLTTVLELPDVPGASRSVRGGPVIAYGRHGALDALGSWSVMFAAVLGGFMFKIRSSAGNRRGRRSRSFARSVYSGLRSFSAGLCRFPADISGDPDRNVGGDPAQSAENPHSGMPGNPHSGAPGKPRSGSAWFMAAALLLAGASLIVNGYAGPDWGIAAGAVLSAAVFIGLSSVGKSRSMTLEKPRSVASGNPRSGSVLHNDADGPYPGTTLISDVVMAAGSFLIIICSAVNAVSIASIAADLFIPMCLALVTAAALCAFCLRLGNPDFFDDDSPALRDPHRSAGHDTSDMRPMKRDGHESDGD